MVQKDIVKYYPKCAKLSDVGFHFGAVCMIVSRCGAFVSRSLLQDLWGYRLGPILASHGAPLVRFGQLLEIFWGFKPDAGASGLKHLRLRTLSTQYSHSFDSFWFLFGSLCLLVGFPLAASFWYLLTFSWAPFVFLLFFSSSFFRNCLLSHRSELFAGPAQIAKKWSKVHLRTRRFVPNSNKTCNYKCNDLPAIA